MAVRISAEMRLMSADWHLRLVTEKQTLPERDVSNGSPAKNTNEIRRRSDDRG